MRYRIGKLPRLDSSIAGPNGSRWSSDPSSFATARPHSEQFPGPARRVRDEPELDVTWPAPGAADGSVCSCWRSSSCPGCDVGPPNDPTPARRARRVGDAPSWVRVRPPWRDDRDHPQDGRVGLRGAAGEGTRPLLTGLCGRTGLAFSPDGQSLAVGGAEPTLPVDVGAGGAGHRLGMPICFVSGLAVSPDGRLLAAASSLDHEIVVWDLAWGGSGRGCGATDPS